MLGSKVLTVHSITLFILLLGSSVSAWDIPFEEKNWELLSYSGISANSVKFKNGEMHIAVNKSASPIVYPLETPKTFEKLTFSAKINGHLQLGDKPQGEEGGDDFLLRVGVVYEGDQKLGFFEQMTAPKWVKRLFSISEGARGIEKIRFYNVVSDKRLLGKSRIHPLSKFLEENFILLASENGHVSKSIRIPSKSNILAIWISSDGDDTDSAFDVKIKKLSLE